MEFWLSESPSHDIFLFSRWNSGYQEAFFINFFSFFTMEFWLSRSLSHELFSLFTMKFWLSWSLSHELFALFTMEFWLSGSLFHELFSFFTMEFWLSRSLFTNFFLFSRWNSRNTQFRGRLFSYIYHKEYLHRIRLVKNLAF
jgi:hypothetical protein